MLRFVSFAFALVLAASAAQAQPQDPSAYPDRTVRIIVPFPAGGTADALPRIVAEKLRPQWTQGIVIENRAGAGGNIGAGLVASAAPDGYTLLSSPPGPIAINQYLYKRLSYDPATLGPVVILAEVPNVLAVRKDFPATNVQDLIAHAKANPGKVNYASQGHGTTSHLTAEMFQSMADLKMTHVAYRGSAPALVDLAGGVVDLMFDNLASSLTLHNAGRLRILAVGGTQRVPQLPDIPTLQELGLKDFQSVTWFAMVAPAGTPAPIVARINGAVNAALHDSDTRNQFLSLGAKPIGGSSADMARFVAAERQRWSAVIKAANITVEEQ